MVAPLTEAASKPAKFTRFEAVGSDTVEIAIGDAVVRAGGDVDPTASAGQVYRPRACVSTTPS
ncbi:hypothetical protein [Dongia sp.]|uniref:hypothetical protein n=1 Tax=Dongia sp. TaxID=1977262 RepID=UPI0035B2A235